MKYGLILTCAMLLASAACPADEINVSGMAYTKVKITGFDGKMVSFTFLGRPIKKSITQVKSIIFDDDKRFTEAENMVAAGRFHAAIRVYETAARLASSPWKKALIEYRMKAAKAKVLKVTDPNGGGNGGTVVPKANKCKACQGTGKMWCRHCGRGEAATGKANCERCKGKGRTACPQCHGQWQLDACTTCKGKGIRTKYDWKWNAAARKIQPLKSTVTCEKCAGKGCTRICQTCGGQPKELRGTIRCLTCQGSGTTAKTCPVCKGVKKVTCTFCDGTGVAKKVTIAVKPPNGGNGQKPPNGGNGGRTKPVPVSGPLGSPDALVATLKTEPKHPSEDKQTWARLSVAQRDDAEEAHAQAMVRWLAANEFHDKKVSWSVTLSDLAKRKTGPGYVINASTAGGVLLRASVPTDPAGIMQKLKKGAEIQVRGTIKDYGPVDPQLDPTAPKRAYRIELADATVAPM